MPKQFRELRERLLQAGIAPRHVRRYLAELADHLADLTLEEEGAGRIRTEAESTALLRLGTMDDLANAMIEQRKFQSWSARAPWAVFGLGPLVLLMAAYVVACFYLWSLWQVFLPGADTPFGGHVNPGPVYGFQNICIQAGKFYYFAAPVLVGWGVAFIAARQRIRAVWPIVSLALLAAMAATNQVHASRTLVPGGLGHIRLDFVLGSSAQEIYGRLVYASLIFLFTLLPYILWRFQRAHTIPA